MCNCVLPATINGTKLGNNRINQDKSCEEETEKKKLTSVSNRERSTIATTSSSSSSSSPSVQVRGRSRKRRPRSMQPSSPLVLGSSSVWLKFINQENQNLALLKRYHFLFDQTTLFLLLLQWYFVILLICKTIFLFLFVIFIYIFVSVFLDMIFLHNYVSNQFQ